MSKMDRRSVRPNVTHDGSRLGFSEPATEIDDVVAGHFEHAGYLALPGLLSPSALAVMRAEVQALQAKAKRRDFAMECMGGTPRHMTTLGGLEIAELAPSITAFYADDGLVTLLSRLSGLPLELAADPVERHVLNVLHRSGDTHGLHTDDYPIALVLFIESPTCEQGCGHLEFFDVCRPAESSAARGFDPRRNSSEPERFQSSMAAHKPGDAYLLRADRFPHRVRPVHDGCVRTVLNFAYGASNVAMDATPSASILYA